MSESLKLFPGEPEENDAAEKREPVAHQTEDVFVLLPLLAIEYLAGHVAHRNDPEEIIQKVVPNAGCLCNDLKQVIESWNRWSEVAFDKDGSSCCFQAGKREVFQFVDQVFQLDNVLKQLENLSAFSDLLDQALGTQISFVVKRVFAHVGLYLLIEVVIHDVVDAELLLFTVRH